MPRPGNNEGELPVNQTVDPAGKFIMLSNSPPLLLYAMLGPEPPKLVSGYGGFQEQQRPKKRSFLMWQGPGVWRMDVQLLLDGYSVGRTIENEIQILQKMATPQPDQPPSLTLYGPALPKAGGGWYIDDLEWGDGINTPKGTALRQMFTVHLVQQSDTDIIRIGRPDATAANATETTYHLVKGDTLQKIAAKKLGKASRWQEIAKLNHITASTQLTVGRVLRIPAK